MTSINSSFGQDFWNMTTNPTIDEPFNEKKTFIKKTKPAAVIIEFPWLNHTTTTTLWERTRTTARRKQTFFDRKKKFKTKNEIFNVY